MEQRVCAVCGKPYDTGAILLDRRLRNSMERYTKTGWGMCPAHKELKDKGFIALVEVDIKKSEVMGSVIKPSGAYRLGRIAHIKKEAYDKLFDTPAPPQMVMFCDTKSMDKFEELYRKIEKGGDSK
jgi:hypothetical protein